MALHHMVQHHPFLWVLAFQLSAATRSGLLRSTDLSI